MFVQQICIHFVEQFFHSAVYDVLHILQLLDSVGSVDTVRSVLRHILDLVVFSVPFPKLSKTLLKVRIAAARVPFLYAF